MSLLIHRYDNHDYDTDKSLADRSNFIVPHDGLTSPNLPIADSGPEQLIDIERPAEPPGIDGVRQIALESHSDCRGTLWEAHRDAWHAIPRPLQWDVIRSNASVMRGAHVHRRRWDYLTFVTGRATIGLCDLRRDGPTFKSSMLIDIRGEAPAMLLVPPGVIHGIYTHTECAYLYGLTDYYDGTDQDGCVWDDPALSLQWPDVDPLVIERDRKLGSFHDLLARFEALGGVSADIR